MEVSILSAPYLEIGGPGIVLEAVFPSLCAAYDTRRFDLGGIRPEIAPCAQFQRAGSDTAYCQLNTESTIMRIWRPMVALEASLPSCIWN